MAATGSDARTAAPSSLLIAQLARGTRRRIEEAVAPLGLRPRELLALQRLRDRADRRRAIIELSTKGEQVLAKLDRALREIDDEMLATLTASQREALSRLLAEAVENIHADCAQPSDEGC